MLSLNQSELASLAHLAGSLATEVGVTVRSLRERGVDVAATKSSRTDVVTAADHRAELLISDGLRSARPEDGLFGEEGASAEGTSGITWVIDPIDGTVNYLYGLPGYAVSIAATVAVDDALVGDAAVDPHHRQGSADPRIMADGRRAIAGAVYLPVTGELFSAYDGGGAQLGSEPIRVSAETELGLSLVGTGFGYTPERRTEQAEVIRQLIPRVRDVRRMGSAAIDLCMVACGRLDAYYERGLQPWDYAAAALIAREAGALILGREADTRPGEPMLIAGPPVLALALQQAVRDAYRTAGQ